MGEAAKAFWVKEEEQVEIVPAVEFEDIAALSTGVSEDAWKFGSD
ncbi:hypothetical protein DESUT3_15140 [Desulfuromonas versatilis]|uniref:Uncharacterized protein n=1 Tax=Desulfuromonas versatilis TaxID=2802975 RepID=A0ABM8HV99_9BACT|nr:hypothetical protein [Desulfuromonas versatilis]BCR04445.1 hypothetical protein DESUT3_15140 [Desulfuromonas versatilis]